MCSLHFVLILSCWYCYCWCYVKVVRETVIKSINLKPTSESNRLVWKFSYMDVIFVSQYIFCVHIFNNVVVLLLVFYEVKVEQERAIERNVRSEWKRILQWLDDFSHCTKIEQITRQNNILWWELWNVK